jgi:hypothetical protein
MKKIEIIMFYKIKNVVRLYFDEKNIKSKSIVNYEIKSFDVLSDDLKKNINVIKNKRIVCKNKIINYAIDNNNIKILKWLKINFGLKHWKYAFLYMYRRYRIIVLNFLIQNVKIKNVAKGFDFIKTIKFKTKNKYLKGYNKN